MKPRIGLVVVALVLSACGGDPAAPSPSPRSPSATLEPSATVDASPTAEPSPSPTPSPSPEPAAMPTSVDADLSPPALPFEEMIPEGAELTGQWFAYTDEGVKVVLAWQEPGSDFARLPRGYAVWERFGSAPHWRAEFVKRSGAEDAVQEIQVVTTDMSGDGSDDALVFEGIGGSGACGRWSLLDLNRLRRLFARRLCDGRIDPGAFGEPGLVITRSIYREGDAHCCPSAIRETVLTWTGSGWRVARTATHQP
jgi:hypothetical protein